MKTKFHPAVAVYNAMACAALSSKTSVPQYPDPVGVGPLRAELRKQNILFPDNIIDFRKWCVEIGVQTAARKVKKAWDKCRRK